MKKTLCGLAVASVTLATAAGAQASTLDFTSLGTFTGASYANAGGASGVIDGVTWTLAGGPSGLTYNFPAGNGALSGPGAGYDGTGTPATTLALQGDGVGMVDDEIRGPKEYLTLTFSKAVRVTAVHFLDLFFRDGIEQVDVSGDLTFRADAAEELVTNQFGGYTRWDVTGPNLVKSLRFTPQSILTGDDATTDFALAGLDIAPVPLPAGGLLLLTALGGLAFARRHKSSTKRA